MEHQRSPLGAARRAEFKSPPSARPGSQDERRARALEEQKRVSLHIAGESLRDFSRRFPILTNSPRICFYHPNIFLVTTRNLDVIAPLLSIGSATNLSRSVLCA